MEKHLLITVSDEMSHLCGVRFVANFFKQKKAFRLTLLYVASTQPTGDWKADRPRSKAKIPAETQARGQKALDRSAEILMEAGFDEAQIQSKLIPKEMETVKEIVMEARRGCYDAVVLGRRGYAAFAGVFSTSVSTEVLRQPLPCPLWICRNPGSEHERVVLCVDDAEASMRITDHVGFMLRDEEHRVCLFHVITDRAQQTRDIIDKATKVLEDNGVASQRIDRKIMVSQNVAEAIMDDHRESPASVIAMGHEHEGSHGFFGGIFSSSVCSGVLKRFENGALWISK
ncbi:universal stress protein [Desulfosoma caldarium]|uniref:Nucleotide-binding universal stress UspA family protein n=1 Tax=Desulfosoma caldarium TaxID=610254 RepID=A0A3N1UDS2_9BACT|nr:universal stress protein [Desulfosoma caldarium]ROQ89562.1 nucleotide-binding universal stress UspA family protein [Desulfosoma caldarium]